MSLYNASGTINLTSVSGSSYTGLSAIDGSWNIVINTSTIPVGLYHPCGALNAVVVTDPSSGYYNINGSMNVISNGSGGYNPVYPASSSSGGDAPVLLSIPTGFNWTPPFNVFRTPSGVYSTDFNVNTYIPPIVQTYYTGALTGASANPGTRASPLHTLPQAFAKADVDQVVMLLQGVQAANGAYITWGGNGWGGVSPTRSLSVLPDAGGRICLVAAASAGAPTWTKVAGLNNTYSTTIAGSATNGPTDLHHLDGNGDFVKPLNVASQALVDTTPNSWFYDGTSTISVQAIDSRNLVADPYMTPGYTATQGAFNINTNVTCFVQNIDFVGGFPFLCNQTSAPAGTPPTLVMENCSFQGGVNGADGWTINGQYLAILQNCSFTNNGDDGIGAHALNSVSPHVFENNCRTGFNGYATGGSNQASSWHDSVIGVTLNPNYVGSENQTIRDITNTQRWSLGGDYFAPTETDLNGQTYSVEGTSVHWIDGTTVHPATVFTLDIENTAVLNWRNSVPGLDTLTKSAGTGTLQPY